MHMSHLSHHVGTKLSFQSQSIAVTPDSFPGSHLAHPWSPIPDLFSQGRYYFWELSDSRAKKTHEAVQNKIILGPIDQFSKIMIWAKY